MKHKSSQELPGMCLTLDTGEAEQIYTVLSTFEGQLGRSAYSHVSMFRSLRESGLGLRKILCSTLFIWAVWQSRDRTGPLAKHSYRDVHEWLLKAMPLDCHG